MSRSTQRKHKYREWHSFMIDCWFVGDPPPKGRLSRRKWKKIDQTVRKDLHKSNSRCGWGAHVWGSES
jgi:hypothetical protein